MGIRRTRVRLGLTQAELARKFGVSRWTVTSWEAYEAGLDAPRGRRPIAVGLVKLALLRIAQSWHPRSEAESRNLRRQTQRREQKLARERGAAGYW